MRTQRAAIILFRASILALLAVTFTACTFTSPAPDSAQPTAVSQANDAPLTVAVAAPIEGAVYLAGVPVNVLARVENADASIDRVEIAVDGVAVITVPQANPMGAPAFVISQNWVAEGTGARALSVTVYNADGTSTQPVTRTIEVVASADNVAVVEQAAQPPADVAPTEEQAAPPPADTASTEEQAAPPPAADTAPTEEQAAPPPAEPTAIPPSATPATPSGTLTTGVNVRGGPSTEFVRVGSLPANERVDLLAVNSARTWYKIRYYYGDGWVSADLMNVINEAGLPIDDGPPLPTPVPPTATPVPATEVPPSNRNLAFSGPTGLAPFPPDCGQTMSITLRLTNNGSEGLGSTSAAVVRDIHIDSGAVTETTIPVPDIGAGESIEVSGGFLTVDTNFESQHRIEIQLDSNGQIAESNEDDNFFSGNEYTLGKGSC